MTAGKIYCPNCNRKLGSYDGRGTIPKVIDCKDCKKRVVFNPETGKTEVVKIPSRSTSSGKTFY